MATVKERVPKSLRGPVGIASLLTGIAGIAVGFVLTLLGITLYFDLHGLGEAITATEAAIVTATGLVATGLGYLGWRGFMYFAY